MLDSWTPLLMRVLGLQQNSTSVLLLPFVMPSQRISKIAIMMSITILTESLQAMLDRCSLPGLRGTGPVCGLADCMMSSS